MNRKIVFKIPEFPHISETFLVAQIITAINLGYDIKIITRKIIYNNIYLIEEYELLDKIIIEDYKIPKNKIVRVLKWVLLFIFNLKQIRFIISYFKQQPAFSLTWLYQWVFYKQFSNLDIIHIQYGTYKYPVDLLKKTGLFKPEIIVTFHGHDAFFPLYGYIENNGYYDDLFSSNVLITVNTNYLAEKVKALGCNKNKLDIIPVAVNTSFFHPNNRIKKQEKLIKLITVGRLDKVKGHQYCIEVVNKLVKKGVNVILTIVGEGEERCNLNALIKKHKLEDHVFLEGSKPPLGVREALWNHDVYLLLAVPVEFSRRETQGLATLEAQACGLPVVVFDSGGIKYTVKDGVSGFVCKEFDVNDAALKIELFNQNRALIKEMGEQATIFVNNNYAQNIIDQKWKHVYNEIINK
ncbi:glycosyltransferase [Thalassobellus sediminis]|uniref:glycosyltransferase n=1 Tax=Thalassobellus sediminis TaxID=3367753 RepID=UPI0037AAD27A